MNDSNPQPATRGLLLAVGLISAATLAVQVLQTRLFSVMLWHHLTYMVVTVTLLGFGSGGALLALFPRLGRAHGDPRVAVSTCCSLFGLSLVAAFIVLCHTPLDTLDIEQDRAKYFLLFLRYAYLVVPFLFAGMAIAIALQQYPATVHRTYFWNLIGSGVGSFLFLLLVRPLGGPGCLFLFATLGGAAGLLALLGARAHSFWPVRLIAIGALAIWPASLAFPQVAQKLVPVEPARSKAMGTLDLFYEVVAEHYAQQDKTYPGLDQKLRTSLWTPTCRIDTVPKPREPQAVARDREDPANAPRGQVHVFQDGDAPTVIWSGGFAKEFDYASHFYGLGYLLVDEPDALVIGPGGGNDVETALHHGARAVTAVDINGDTLALVRGKFGDYTDGIYERDRVTPIWSEGRSYLRRSGRTFDLIQMSGTDTYAALSSGSYIFSESYLYTEEAFDDFFAHLSERGVISIIRFRFEPPRETLKLVATAARALRRLGIEDPRRHFLVVHQEDRQIPEFAAALRAMQGLTPRQQELARRMGRDAREPMRYAVAIMRKTPFAEVDVARIEAAIPRLNVNQQVSHWLYYGAGLRGEDNEYARLLAAAGQGPEAERAFHADYRYRTGPASDDRPFFFNFHSWRDVSFGSRSDDGYMALTGSQPIGLYILAALAIQTLLATLLLVLVPLLRLGFDSSGQNPRLRVIGYFAALGLAYLLVEISTIQRFVLYLGHPVYSLSVGLCSFLVFSGLGSATAGRLDAGRRGAAMAGGMVVLLLLAHATLLPNLLQLTLAWSEPMRVLLAMATIAPLAFVMGMPFPTGLRLLHGEAPGTIAWAFGVNGAASVMASILSILIAMEAGFFVVMLLAAALYALAGVLVPRAGLPARAVT